MGITHVIDKADIWLRSNGFRFKGDIKDRTGQRFALIYTYDSRNVVVAGVRYIISSKGYDKEIIDRDKFITDQVTKYTGKSDYIACMYVDNQQSLYIVDNIEVKKQSYEISKGNDINRNYNYEQRKNYELPMNDGTLVNFFSWKKKQPTTGESFWIDQFSKYFVDNPVRWVGNESTHYQLKQSYGWAVDFIVYKCNACIEEGYHTPAVKSKRKRYALEKNVKVYFIDQKVEYYKENPSMVGKVLREISQLFEIKLSNQYEIDFRNTISLFEEDE